MYALRRLSLVLVLVLAAAPARAQDAAVAFERIEGLSHNTVFTILQDHRGFLWIGTSDGLNRYDGYQFQVYRQVPGDSTSLPANSVRVLLEDRERRLWVGTSSGLSSLDAETGRFVRHRLPGETSPDVAAIAQDPSGRLWVTTYRGRLYRSDLSKRRFHVRRAMDPESGAATHVLASDGGASMLLLSIQGDAPVRLRRYGASAEERDTLALPGDYRRPGHSGIPPMHADSSGTLWVAAPPPRSVDSSAPFAFLPGLPADAEPHDIIKARDGTVWVGAETALYRFDPKRDELHEHVLDTSATAWLNNNVQCLYEDGSGAVWAGTLSGLYRYDPHRKPFVHWGAGTGLPSASGSRTAMAIAEDPAGTVWIGTVGGGLLQMSRDGNRLATYRHRPTQRAGLPSNIIWFVHEARGRLWLGADPVCAFDPGTGRCTRYPFSSHMVTEDRTGHLWFGDGDTLYRLDPRTGRYERRTTELIQIQVIRPGEQKSDLLWIGTGRGRLGRLDLNTGRLDIYPTQNTATGPSLGSIWAIHEDARGHLWLGTSRGLFRFDPQAESFRSYYDAAALPGAIIYSILEDDEERLWMGTSQGLVRFDVRRERFRHYEVDDGIGSMEFNRRAAYRGTDGTFYFGGLQGVTVFDTSAIRDNRYVPPVVITEVAVANRDTMRTLEVPASEHLKLDYADYTVAFEFAALNFTNPQKNRYTYRLEGFDERWIEAGTRRRVQYTNLPPGGYILRVRGSNNDGRWNMEGASLAISVAPALWQTWWFRLLVAAALVGALAAAYRYRVGHLLAVQRLRLRIASDLHDDVGSKLSSLALMSEAVRDRAALGEEDRRELSRIGRVARQLTSDLREIVWFVDPEHDGDGALQWKMKNAAAALLREVDYRFRCPSARLLGSQDTAVRRNVFLIYKEALHNVVRHAQAETVEIDIRQHDGRFEFSIADDGVGFDADAAYAGHGLKNMRLRAQRIGAGLDIESRQGGGACVSLTVPLR